MRSERGVSVMLLVKHATFKVYEGAPHGLAETHKARLNQDLLDFVKS